MLVWYWDGTCTGMHGHCVSVWTLCVCVVGNVWALCVCVVGNVWELWSVGVLLCELHTYQISQSFVQFP